MVRKKTNYERKGFVSKIAGVVFSPPTKEKLSSTINNDQKWRPRKNMMFSKLDGGGKVQVSDQGDGDLYSAPSTESDTAEYKRENNFEVKKTAFKHAHGVKRDLGNVTLKPSARDRGTSRSSIEGKKSRVDNVGQRNDSTADPFENNMFDLNFSGSIDSSTHYSSSTKQDIKTVNSDPSDFFSKVPSKLTAKNLESLGIENRNPRTEFHQFTIDEDKESTVILPVGDLVEHRELFSANSETVEDEESMGVTSKGTRIQKRSADHRTRVQQQDPNGVEDDFFAQRQHQGLPQNNQENPMNAFDSFGVNSTASNEFDSFPFGPSAHSLNYSPSPRGTSSHQRKLDQHIQNGGESPSLLEPEESRRPLRSSNFSNVPDQDPFAVSFGNSVPFSDVEVRRIQQSENKDLGFHSFEEGQRQTQNKSSRGIKDSLFQEPSIHPKNQDPFDTIRTVDFFDTPSKVQNRFELSSRRPESSQKSRMAANAADPFDENLFHTEREHQQMETRFEEPFLNIPTKTSTDPVLVGTIDRERQRNKHHSRENSSQKVTTMSTDPFDTDFREFGTTCETQRKSQNSSDRQEGHFNTGFQPFDFPPENQIKPGTSQSRSQAENFATTEPRRGQPNLTVDAFGMSFAGFGVPMASPLNKHKENDVAAARPTSTHKTGNRSGSDSDASNNMVQAMDLFDTAFTPFNTSVALSSQQKNFEGSNLAMNEGFKNFNEGSFKTAANTDCEGFFSVFETRNSTFSTAVPVDSDMVLEAENSRPRRAAHNMESEAPVVSPPHANSASVDPRGGTVEPSSSIVNSKINRRSARDPPADPILEPFLHISEGKSSFEEKPASKAPGVSCDDQSTVASSSCYLSSQKSHSNVVSSDSDDQTRRSESQYSDIPSNNKGPFKKPGLSSHDSYADDEYRSTTSSCMQSKSSDQFSYRDVGRTTNAASSHISSSQNLENHAMFYGNSKDRHANGENGSIVSSSSSMNSSQKVLNKGPRAQCDKDLIGSYGDIERNSIASQSIASSQKLKSDFIIPKGGVRNSSYPRHDGGGQSSTSSIYLSSSEEERKQKHGKKSASPSDSKHTSVSFSSSISSSNHSRKSQQSSGESKNQHAIFSKPVGHSENNRDASVTSSSRHSRDSKRSFQELSKGQNGKGKEYQEHPSTDSSSLSSSKHSRNSQKYSDQSKDSKNPSFNRLKNMFEKMSGNEPEELKSDGYQSMTKSSRETSERSQRSGHKQRSSSEQKVRDMGGRFAESDHLHSKEEPRRKASSAANLSEKQSRKSERQEQSNLSKRRSGNLRNDIVKKGNFASRRGAWTERVLPENDAIIEPTISSDASEGGSSNDCANNVVNNCAWPETKPRREFPPTAKPPTAKRESRDDVILETVGSSDSAETDYSETGSETGSQTSEKRIGIASFSNASEKPIGIASFAAVLQGSSSSIRSGRDSENRSIGYGSHRKSRNLYSHTSAVDDYAYRGKTAKRISGGSFGGKASGLPNNAIVASMLFRTQHNVDTNVVDAKLKAKEDEDKKLANNRGDVPRSIHAVDGVSCVSSFSEDTAALQEQWRKPTRDLLEHFARSRKASSVPKRTTKQQRDYGAALYHA